MPRHAGSVVFHLPFSGQLELSTSTTDNVGPFTIQYSSKPTHPTRAANPLTASQSSKRHRAKISSWDHSKGFGFLRHQGKDLFLHRRDFSEHHKKPAPGDLIHYELGKDTQGRPCAVRALHHNDGGRLTLASILLLAALLILPSLALFYLYTTSDHIQKWLFVIPLGASFITYYLYALDKKRARSKQWRISENSLHFMELIGGWPGAFIAQKKLRHKCAKGTYQIIYHIIIIAHQYIWLDYLTNWQISQMIMASLTKNP